MTTKTKEHIDIDTINALDKSDSLASMADLFSLPDKLIYLDGNSLGAMPKAAAKRVQEVVLKEWGEDLIHSWNDNNWFTLTQSIGDKIGQLIGADSGQVIVSDCVSINLFKLIVAALKKQHGRSKIVSEAGNFPTDLYVMQGIANMFDDHVEVVTASRDDLANQIDEDTAIVVLTHAHYKSSELWDMKEFTRLAHDKGALILWDLCHTAGVLPIELDALQVDMAVGCGYKYLNGGPGAPAFLYITRHLQGELQQPLSGWWGHNNPFQFIDEYQPAPDIRQAQSGTQSVLALAALEVGIDTALKASLNNVRDKSEKLGDIFISLLQQQCPELNIASPLEASQRGSHVSVTHSEGYALAQVLREKGVVVDFRAPDIIRFGFAPLYISYMDIWRTVEILVDIVTTNAWDQEKFRQKATVT